MITVFTPTYNRAYILSHVYESLKIQTSKDFEWIIVDDGSTDNTENLVKTWQMTDNGFPIRYIWQKNGGKHRAINRAVSLARGEWLSIIDSDDYYLPNAIENILLWTNETIPDYIAGIAGTKCYSNGNIIGGMPSLKSTEYIDISIFDRDKYKLLGDKSEVMKTEIWKKYPFPEFDGELFLSESAFFNRITFDGYKIRYYNTPLKVCEYLSDGLSKNINDIQRINYKGYTYCSKIIVDNSCFNKRILEITRYIIFSKELSLSHKEIYNNIKCNKLDYSISAFGYLIYRFLKKHNIYKYIKKSG